MAKEDALETVLRRTICRLGLGQFAGLLASLPSFSPELPGAPSDIEVTWGRFLAKVASASRQQNSPRWDQEGYVNRVASLASQLNSSKDQALRQIVRRPSRLRIGAPELTRIERSVEFEVVLISFEPGEVIPYHDHAGLAGVMLCTSGEVEVRSCELVDQSISRGSLCHLRRTVTTTLSHGLVSTLTARRGSIHQVSALRRSQVLDIFAPPYTRERDMQVHWYQPLREFRLGGKDFLQARVRS